MQTSNNAPRLEFHPESGGFYFPSRQAGRGISTGAMGITVICGGKCCQTLLTDWRQMTESSLQEGVEEYECILPGIEIAVRLYVKPALAMWKIQLDYRGQHSIRLYRIDLLWKAVIENKGSTESLDYGFYENGWQSWSYSAAYSTQQRARRTNFGKIYPGVWSAEGTPQPRGKGQFASDFYGVLIDRQQRNGWVAGFLSQREQFGTITADLRQKPSLSIWANCNGVVVPSGGKLETDWAILIETSLNSQEDPLAEYLEQVALENLARVPKQAPAGWCSWYHYYQNVSAVDVDKNLQAAIENREQWPLDLIQVDDGYETLVGEWDRFNSRFPKGLAGLASQIKDADLIPGIWMAPFIFHPRAETVIKHPEWMIGDQSGRPRFAGFNWNSRTVALDLTHPEAQEWLRQTIRRAVVEWGFPYLKLDFLYAGGLSGKRYDPTRTNAQALYTGLKIIREEAGEDTFLLGCGCPIGPGVGILDSMRISADTAPAWGNYYFGIVIPFMTEQIAPSAKNALHNVLTRANMHQKLWWNDPDCLLLRPDSHLTLQEIQTAASVIALTGGMLLVSDDLQALPGDRQIILSQMLPPIQHSGVVLDWLTETEPAVVLWENEGEKDPYALVAMINWESKPRRLSFDPKKYGRKGTQWLSNFWNGHLTQLAEGQVATFENVPAHGTVLLAVRDVGDLPVQYLGGNLHISQGLEVKSLICYAHRFELEIDLPRRWQGEIRLWAKKELISLNLQGENLKKWTWKDGVLRISLAGTGKGQLVGVW